MPETEENFLREKFRAYYAKNYVKEPPSIEMREFGTGSYGKKISNRHFSFKSHEELDNYLRNEVPFYISSSSAYYMFPERKPMDAKKILGADLIYEFDADDIKTNCKEKHDSWCCAKCGATGFGNIENCTNCGERVSVEQWFCNECLGETKKQVFKLLDFLETDFGFKEISVNFSGNAGYHVHVRSKEIRELKQGARIELLDYLTATNINFNALGFSKEGKMMRCPVPEKTSGWGKKILNSLSNFFNEADAQKIAAIGGIPLQKAKDLISKKELLLKNLSEKGVLLSPGTRNDADFWNSIFEYVRAEVSLDIDRQTSVDISKVVRVPETIHGGTGLLAKKIPREKLSEFDPFSDAVVFGDTKVRVFINKAPKLIFGGEEYGPFDNFEGLIPEYLAIYLIARNSAKLR